MKNLIIDGNNLVHRVYWVANNQKDESGKLHVYFFLNSLKRYVEMFRPDNVFCVWDEKIEPQENRRKEIFEDYKGNRNKEYNKEVHVENGLIKDILVTLGIQNIHPRFLEADDLIASLIGIREGDRNVIVTVDRDLCQLIDEKTTVYDAIRKIEIGNSNFEDILKIPKKDFLIYKSIVGDKSDNIPGVTGYGHKRATDVINKKIKLSEENFDIVKRNMSLFILRKNNEDTSYVKEQLIVNKPKEDWNKFKTLCLKNEFSKILKNKEIWYSVFFERNKLKNLFQ